MSDDEYNSDINSGSEDSENEIKPSVTKYGITIYEAEIDDADADEESQLGSS